MTTKRQRHYTPHELFNQRAAFLRGVVVTHLDDITPEDFRAIEIACEKQQVERMALSADFRDWAADRLHGISL
jgi:hypothetical protein